MKSYSSRLKSSSSCRNSAIRRTLQLMNDDDDNTMAEMYVKIIEQSQVHETNT